MAVRIRRLSTRVAPGVAWRYGQIDLVSEEEARTAIEAGLAVLVDGDLPPVESAELKPPRSAGLFGYGPIGGRPGERR